MTPLNDGMLTGSGTIYGTLEDNIAPSIITYDVTGTGGITLIQAPLASAAPEPSQWGMLALVGFGICGLLLKARYRPVR